MELMHKFADYPDEPPLGKRPRCHGSSRPEEEEEEGASIEDLLRKRLRLDEGGDPTAESESDGHRGLPLLPETSPGAAGRGFYPPLCEEPKVGDKTVVCRVGVRMPDGRRAYRNFWRLEPARMLWSFCYSLLQEEERARPFRLVVAIPGAARCLSFESQMSFDESHLSNVIVSMVWK